MPFYACTSRCDEIRLFWPVHKVIKILITTYKVRPLTVRTTVGMVSTGSSSCLISTAL